MALWTLIVATTVWIEPAPAVQFADARALYDAGRWADAAVAFERLRVEPEPVGPTSAFGYANARVLQATRQGDPAAARRSLREAIAVYRVLLDQGAPAPLRGDDIRHNMELAKRLLPPAGADESSPPPSPTTPLPPPAEQAPAPGSDRPTSEPENQPTAKASTTESKGNVERAEPGRASIDPGPAPKAQALERLRKTLTRVASESATALEAPPPRAVGDY